MWRRICYYEITLFLFIEITSLQAAKITQGFFPEDIHEKTARIVSIPEGREFITRTTSHSMLMHAAEIPHTVRSRSV
jgi:hypothetical protein